MRFCKRCHAHAPLSAKTPAEVREWMERHARTKHHKSLKKMRHWQELFYDR